MAESAGAIQAQITAVDAAITRALAMQSAGSDGSSIQNANLKDLYARRDVLQRRLDQANAVAADAGGSSVFSRTRVTGNGQIFQ